MARLHSSQAAGYKIAKAFLREESHWDPYGNLCLVHSPRDLKVTPVTLQGDLVIVYVDTRSWHHSYDIGSVRKYSKGRFVKSDSV